MSHDTLIHRGLRPVLRPLARTGLSPDALTALRLVVGLAAAAAIGFGGAPLRDAGAGLFGLGMLLDRADGELARQSRRFSRFGARFDVAADCLSIAAAFAALGFGPRPAGMAPAEGWLLGALAGGGILALFARLDALPPALGGFAPGRMPRRPFDPDDSLLLLPPAIWCGGGGVVLWLAAVGAPLAAALVWAMPLLRRGRDPVQAADRSVSSARSASSRVSHSPSVPTVMRR